MIHKATIEQELIYSEITDIVNSPRCGRNLMIKADAGTGKSSTIQEGTKYIPDPVLYLAYNVHIADDYRPKALPNTEVRTIHSHGNKAILSTFKYGQGIEVILDEYKVNNLVKNMLTTQYLEVGGENTKLLQTVIPKFVSYLKSTLMPMSKESIEFLAEKFQLEDYYILLENNNEKTYAKEDGTEYVIDSNLVTDMCSKIMKICFRAFLPNESCSIDYDDQFWLPIVRPDIKVKKFPWVIVDECLPYYIPILLADGTSKEIGEIVENKISTNVLAYDEVNKIQKSCKIVGWHKIPNTKKLLKIKVRWSQKVGTNTKYTFTVCTEDHKIWTPTGYKEAQNIQIGDEVQVETSASITQKYKITSKGKDKVSECITKRNKETSLPHYTPTKEEFMKIRKGNGHGITIPQKILTESLGDGWINEYPIKTKCIGGRSSGFPTNYKVDIANPTKMIAIEVDGRSHDSVERKEKDIKKESALQKLGWKVLRFKNEDILRNINTIVENIKNLDCPISAKVISVEAVHTDEYYVYDIDVEECHNFYANGILVHNCQDLNPAQMKLVMMSVTPNGTIIVVGDPHQCIIEGTKILTENGEIPIENIKNNKLISAIGGNKSLLSNITNISKIFVENKPIVTIETLSGKKVTTTSEHIHFAGFVNDSEGEWYYTYLMYDSRFGYRIGITKKTRNHGKNPKSFGYKSRLNQERAEKMWLLEVSNTVFEAKYWEQYYSVKYGIPTWIFYTKNRFSINQNLGYRNEDIKRLFNNLDTTSSAINLLKSKNMFIEYPHHIPKCVTLKRRRNFSITLCANNKLIKNGRKTLPMHTYAISGSDSNDMKLLKNIGLNVRISKKSIKNGWRLESARANLKDIYNILDKVKSVIDINLIEQARFGNRSLPLIPASHVLPNMKIFIIDENKNIIEDTVISVKHDIYTGNVYDLNIERYHNYIAGGIVTHNSIYSFRGADAQAMPKMQEQLKTKVFTLSTCFRCPTEHVKLAQKYVSSIQPFTNNKAGTIAHINDTILYNTLVNMLPNKDPIYVLCRNNYPLIKPCFELIRNGKNATIRGAEIGKNLIARIRATKGTQIEEFKKNLTLWMQKEKTTLDLANKSIEMLMDKYDTLIALSENCNNTDQLIAKIDKIFSDKDSAIIFSSIHKNKGFESNIVYILYPELMPSSFAKTSEAMEQENNLQYISVTRSKDTLIFVHELKEGMNDNESRTRQEI